MPWKQDEPKWVPDEYPKMLVRDGQPVVYPEGHEKQGLVVVFESEDDETAFKGNGKPKSGKKSDK